MTALKSQLTPYTLQVGDLRDRAPIVVRSPQHSLIHVMFAAAEGLPMGVPRNLQVGIRRALRADAWFGIRPMLYPGTMFIPDCVTPTAPTRDVTIAEQIEWFSDTSGDRLLAELERMYGNRVPSHWRSAADDPARWMRSMAFAVADGWSVMCGFWKESEPAIDREIERVGVAVVRDGLEPLLNSLHPRIGYQDGDITFDSTLDTTVSLGDRRIALVPMLGAAEHLLVDFEHPEIAYIGYPILGPTGALRPTQRSLHVDALGLILGDPRAKILRTLGTPTVMSVLAAEMGYGSSTMTYHCDQLEKAGLVVRRRFGQTVRVSRTSRGEGLLDLLA